MNTSHSLKKRNAATAQTPRAKGRRNRTRPPKTRCSPRARLAAARYFQVRTPGRHEAGLRKDGAAMTSCEVMLEAGGSNPRRIKNNDGKTAYEVQTREIRQVIDLYVLFCGRFDIASLSAPEHATATSVVILAIDTFVPEESDEGVEETKGADSPALSRNVVIKLMKEKEVSDREIAQRKGTNPKHVVVGRGRAPRQPTAPRLTNSAPLSSSAALTNTRSIPRRLQPIICSSEDDDMKEMWAGELKKLGRWQDYKFGIVMPCAQRNLMVGSLHLSMRT